MYKLNKNKLHYKSDQITTSVQRLNSTSEWRRYSDVGTTLYLGRRRRDLNTTLYQRWSNVMCLLGTYEQFNEGRCRMRHTQTLSTGPVSEDIVSIAKDFTYFLYK